MSLKALLSSEFQENGTFPYSCNKLSTHIIAGIAVILTAKERRTQDV
jgi:hypothetical protein